MDRLLHAGARVELFPQAKDPVPRTFSKYSKKFTKRECMENLLKSGKVLLLYKPIPSEILEAHLARYHISYKESFDNIDNVLTDAQRDSFTH